MIVNRWLNLQRPLRSVSRNVTIACRTGCYVLLTRPATSRSPEKSEWHDGRRRLFYVKIYSRRLCALAKTKTWVVVAWSHALARLSVTARWLGSATRRQPMIERLGHLFACTTEWPWAVAWYTRVENRLRARCCGSACVSQPNASGLRLVRRIICRRLRSYRLKESFS